MSTIPRTDSEEKSSYRPFGEIVKLSPEVRLVLVQQGLDSAQSQSDLSPLLAMAGSLLVGSSGRGRHRFGLVGLWPCRVNRDELRGKIACSVLAHWGIADEGTRASLLKAPREMVLGAIEAMQVSDPLAVAEWLIDHPDWACADVVERLVLCDHRDASSLAAGLVTGQVVCALGLAGDGCVGDRLMKLAEASGGCIFDVAGLIEQVVELSTRFEEHRQRDLMTAAVLLAEGPGRATGGPLRELANLFETETGATTGIRAAIRRGTAPFLRARAWRWLASEPVRAAAIERLARASNLQEHELVLREGYLALRPARMATLRMLKVRARATAKGQEPAPGEALPPLAWRGSLSPTARRWLVDVAHMTQTGDAALAQLRAAGLTDSSAWVRWAHHRAATPVEGVDSVFDSDVRIARGALLAWSPAGGRQWLRWPLRRVDHVRLRLTDHATRSPHASVRSIARGDARRTNPWLVNESEGRLAAREWMRSDRGGFVKALRERIELGDEQEQVDAIKLARLLRVGVAIESLLVELAGCDGEHCRVAATAVSAMGELDTPGACAGVRRAFGSGDVRVRANAVEATIRRHAKTVGVTRFDGEVYGSLIELKGDEHHRVRANALRGLIESGGTARGGKVLDPSGVEGLAAMLTDDREMHRLAGLWLAERSLVGDSQRRVGGAWESLSRRVAAMAVRDEAMAVRTRALRCAKRLLAEIQLARPVTTKELNHA